MKSILWLTYRPYIVIPLFLVLFGETTVQTALQTNQESIEERYEMFILLIREKFRDIIDVYADSTNRQEVEKLQADINDLYKNNTCYMHSDYKKEIALAGLNRLMQDYRKQNSNKADILLGIVRTSVSEIDEYITALENSGDDANQIAKKNGWKDSIAIISLIEMINNTKKNIVSPADTSKQPVDPKAPEGSGQARPATPTAPPITNVIPYNTLAFIGGAILLTSALYMLMKLYQRYKKPSSNETAKIGMQHQTTPS